MKYVIARPVIALSILVLLMMGRAASASDAVGWITLLDEETDQIVLDDGRTFALSDDISFAALADGRRVRITYETIAGVPTVTGIIMLAPLADQPERFSLDAPSPVCENRAAFPDHSDATDQMSLFC